ncbi:hypothetical protein DFP72DRAFT_1070561 [Ephemerocybe angulata]|uniref:Uncharacterized protein n=1 Tax=Ephemerocybe angulata TaxID=980116 RepID=A0A8H6HSA4_9AGAR|nr:hypothetical protein DFP72DRAFT_1070561 [Tulosesus angulatus]
MVKIAASFILLSASVAFVAAVPVPEAPPPDTIILTSLTRSTYIAKPTIRPRAELPPVFIPIPGAPAPVDTIILTSLTRTNVPSYPTPRPREVELPILPIPIPGAPAPPGDTIIITSLTRTTYVPKPTPRPRDLEERAELPPFVIPGFPGSEDTTIVAPTTVTRSTYDAAPTVRPREEEEAQKPAEPPIIVIPSITRITPKPGPTITRITVLPPKPTITRTTWVPVPTKP